MCKLKKVSNAKKEAAGGDADEPDDDGAEELAAGAPSPPDPDTDGDPSTSGRAAAQPVVAGNGVPMWAAGSARRQAQPQAAAEGALTYAQCISVRRDPALWLLMVMSAFRSRC